MATFTQGHTFTSNEQVTAAKLHELITSATIAEIQGSEIGALEITNSNVNDVSGAKFTNLANTPAGAGALPIANGGTALTSAGGSANRVLVTTDGAVMSFAQVALASMVTGTLAATNGGTGIATYAQGDILYSSATNTLAKLGAGTSGYFLKTQGASANPIWAAITVGIKIGTLTRLLNAADGDVAYTGVGFQPTHILFIGGNKAVGQSFTIGLDDGTTHQCAYMTGGAATMDYSDTMSIHAERSATNGQEAFVKSFDADGFTLTWNEFGTTAVETLNVVYLALKT
jgi:hypothetical protein